MTGVAEDIQLRPVRPADALTLSALGIQVFLDTYAPEGIRAAVAQEVLTTYSEQAFDVAIANQQTRMVVAERQDPEHHLVGFAQVTLGERHELAPGSGPQSELLRLYVQEPFTGQKLGTRLLAEAEALAARAGSSVLWLTPWVHNHRALAFYARRGYSDHGLTWFRFEGESHENRVLAKLI